MPLVKKQDHIHKYKLVTLSERTGTKVFKCQLCTTYKPREIVVGEESICWGCDKPFRLTMENTTRVKPKCDICRGKVLKVEPDKLDLFLKEMGI